MYGDKDSPPQELEASTPLGFQILGIGVRAVGILVLLVGLWAGVRIILEAFALYQEPARIERFAEAIQEGSNIDDIFGNSLSKVLDTSSSQGSAGSTGDDSGGLRVSYFAAWLIALLLMSVIGMLSMTAITTGGQLALYDLQVRHYSRAMVREWRRSQHQDERSR